jgi:hypothetical protein
MLAKTNADTCTAEENKIDNLRKVNEGASTSTGSEDKAYIMEVDRNRRGDNWLSLHLPENVSVTQRQYCNADRSTGSRRKANKRGHDGKNPAVRHYWLLWDTLVC